MSLEIGKWELVLLLGRGLFSLFGIKRFRFVVTTMGGVVDAIDEIYYR